MRQRSLQCFFNANFLTSTERVAPARPRIPARADAGQLRVMRRTWHIGWHMRWGTAFPPSDTHNTLIPRQFACVITPDPIAFLLPNGHQRATRAGHTDTDAAGKPIGSGAPRHDELARTVHRSPVRYNKLWPVLFARDTNRVQRQALTTDRSLYQRHEHSARRGGLPMHTNHNHTPDYILGTLSTGESVPVLQADRRRHIYIIGQTGAGKTGLYVLIASSISVLRLGRCESGKARP